MAPWLSGFFGRTRQPDRSDDDSSVGETAGRAPQSLRRGPSDKTAGSGSNENDRTIRIDRSSDRVDSSARLAWPARDEAKPPDRPRASPSRPTSDFGSYDPHE